MGRNALINLILAAVIALSGVQTAVISSDKPTLCDGTSYSKWWVAPAPIKILRVEMLPLSDGAAPGQPFPSVDYHTTVFSSRPPGRVVAMQGLDHYVPFTGDPQLSKVFTNEEAPRLKKGDNLAVIHSCQAQWGLISHSQFVVIVTYLITGSK